MPKADPPLAENRPFHSASRRGGPRTNPFGIMQGKLQGRDKGNFYPALRAKRDSCGAARRANRAQNQFAPVVVPRPARDTTGQGFFQIHTTKTIFYRATRRSRARPFCLQTTGSNIVQPGKRTVTMLWGGLI